jgi:photosystem II stability/assembly factor-like uncharacterized protein
MYDWKGYPMKKLPFLLFFLLLAVPAQAQWQWLNPLPEGNEFYDAAFATTQNGWVVGGNGSLLRSTDGGATWSSQPSILRTTPFLGLSIAFADDQTGVIAMNNGLMLRTTDGGNDWELLPRTGMVLQKVRKAPDGSLWAVGSLGAIARSTDGGLTWDPFATGISTVVFDIDFPDALTAVAACGGGLVLRSTDGGVNWEQHSAPLGTDITSISFRDAGNGFAIQRPKYLLHSTDGGQSWSDTSFTVNELLDVQFISEQTGWLVSNSPGSVFKTTDGGQSWQFVAVEQPRRFTFYAVHARDEQNVFLLGTGGALFSTTDGGQNWTQHGDAFTRAHLNGVRAVSDSSAWIFGDGSAFYTGDRGQSWSGSDTISLPGFRSGYALSESRIIGTGSQGQLMLSTDAGASWSTQTLTTSGQIEEMDFIDANTGWLTGAHGSVARTTDAGATWTEFDPGVDTDFNGVAAISADVAYIVGNGGSVFHTSDAGQSWTQQSTPINTNLETVEFVSATEGWAGGQLALIHTTDAGATWTEVKDLVGVDVVYDINFTDAQHGYFMLSRAVARTSDGGASFYRTDYPALGLQDIDARPDGSLWLVGKFGVTQRYTPAAAIVVQPDVLDFGDVAVGKQRDLPYTVFNRGEIDLTFTNVTTVGPGFLFGNGDLSPIVPGGSREITVAFAPLDTGRAYGTATVYSNAALGIPFVDLLGNGIPPGTSAFAHAPDTLDFGSLLLGTFSSKFVHLHNRSTQPLLITREVITGGDSTMFQVTLESTYFFAADKRDSVQVTFAPVRPGNFTTTLLIESNDQVEPLYRIPVRGTALTPVIASDGLYFGYVLLDSSKTLNLVIRNEGTSPLTISSMTPGGTDAALFAFTDPGQLVIAAGDSVLLPVTFTPRTWGPKSAEIVAGSDDLANGTYVIPLTGNATTLAAGQAPFAQDVQLSQNYPNPVTGKDMQATYLVRVPAHMHVRLVLHDVLGREVLRMHDGYLSSGTHAIPLHINGLPNGSYHAVLRVTGADGRSVQRQVQTIIMN